MHFIKSSKLPKETACNQLIWIHFLCSRAIRPEGAVFNSFSHLLWQLSYTFNWPPDIKFLVLIVFVHFARFSSVENKETTPCDISLNDWWYWNYFWLVHMQHCNRSSPGFLTLKYESGFGNVRVKSSSLLVTLVMKNGENFLITELTNTDLIFKD